MNTTTIICYGDSNTYGFDPRSFLGGRYDKNNRCCDLVQKNTGFNMVNCGENGRTIPVEDFEFRLLDKMLEYNAPVDGVVVMLGSNDMLLCGSGNAYKTADKMENLIVHLKAKAPNAKILLLTPPPVNIPSAIIKEKMQILNTLYKEIAQKQKIHFADTGTWNLSLSHDGVHLSEEGHHSFAANIQFILMDVMGLK